MAVVRLRRRIVVEEVKWLSLPAAVSWEASPQREFFLQPWEERALAWKASVE